MISSADRILRKVFFKGGGSSGDTYDAAYNARMASIAEVQQDMANQYFNFWASDYKPMEQAQIAANMKLIPSETALNLAQNKANLSLIPGQTSLASEQIEAERSLLPGQTALTGEQIASARTLLPGQTQLTQTQMDDTMTAIGERAPVRTAFYNESLNGVDVNGRVNRAAADATQSFMNSNNIMRRNASRMGINPNSGRFGNMMNTNSLNRAKTIAGAKTQARTQAENDKYGRLSTAMNYGGY